MTKFDPLTAIDDEQLMMDYVICGESDLLLLDVLLRESFTTNA